MDGVLRDTTRPAGGDWLTVPRDSNNYFIPEGGLGGDPIRSPRPDVLGEVIDSAARSVADQRVSGGGATVGGPTAVVPPAAAQLLPSSSSATADETSAQATR
jgi:hypothetical protein